MSAETDSISIQLAVWENVQQAIERADRPDTWDEFCKPDYGLLATVAISAVFKTLQTTELPFGIIEAADREFCSDVRMQDIRDAFCIIIKHLAEEEEIAQESEDRATKADIAQELTADKTALKQDKAAFLASNASGGE